MQLFLLAMGVLAGALTTVAGLGGGILLTLALSFTMTPAEALALTSPALLVGMLHRAHLNRRAIDRRVAAAFAIGAFPGSVVGGALLPAIPAGMLRVLLVGAAASGVVQAIRRRRAPAREAARGERRGAAAAWIAAAGFGIGAVGATIGSAGLMVGPLLLSTGLTGAADVATAAAAGRATTGGSGGNGAVRAAIRSAQLMISTSMPGIVIAKTRSYSTAKIASSAS
ncbi:MAG: TSUP family transporter, partial [Polyangiaceae bacterium]|nr:TSUP family transporter [Polyangiaceae bacterium]